MVYCFLYFLISAWLILFSSFSVLFRLAFSCVHPVSFLLFYRNYCFCWTSLTREVSFFFFRSQSILFFTGVSRLVLVQYLGLSLCRPSASIPLFYSFFLCLRRFSPFLALPGIFLFIVLPSLGDPSLLFTTLHVPYYLLVAQSVLSFLMSVRVNQK